MPARRQLHSKARDRHFEIRGSTANTYSGNTTVSKGILQLANTIGNAISKSNGDHKQRRDLQLLATRSRQHDCRHRQRRWIFDLNGKTETIETAQSSSAEKVANAVTSASINLGAGSFAAQSGSAALYNVQAGSPDTSETSPGPLGANYSGVIKYR